MKNQGVAISFAAPFLYHILLRNLSKYSGVWIKTYLRKKVH